MLLEPGFGDRTLDGPLGAVRAPFVLPADVEARITGWWPKDLDDSPEARALVDTCRRIVAAGRPVGPRQAVSVLSTVRRFLLWLVDVETGVALDAGTALLTQERLAAYLADPAGLAERPKGSVDAAHSFLRGIGPEGPGLTPADTNRTAGRPGGCEHCVTADGDPVLGADGVVKPRCCTTRSKVFTAEALRWYQDQTFGTIEWYRAWNIRNRVEGSYGIIKNLSLMNYGRDYHHFTGIARESLAAGFALAAHNMHMIRTWQAQQAELERRLTRHERRHLPPAQPTETMPPRPKPPVVRPIFPKGLPELGSDPPDS